MAKLVRSVMLPLEANIPARLKPHNILLFLQNEQHEEEALLAYDRRSVVEFIDQCEQNAALDGFRAALQTCPLPETSDRPARHITGPAVRTLCLAKDRTRLKDQVLPQVKVFSGIMTAFCAAEEGIRADAICPFLYDDMRSEVHVLYSVAHYRELAMAHSDLVSDEERLEFIELVRNAGLPEASDDAAICIDGVCANELYLGLLIFRLVG